MQKNLSNEPLPPELSIKSSSSAGFVKQSPTFNRFWEGIGTGIGETEELDFLLLA